MKKTPLPTTTYSSLPSRPNARNKALLETTLLLARQMHRKKYQNDFIKITTSTQRIEIKIFIIESINIVCNRPQSGYRHIKAKDAMRNPYNITIKTNQNGQLNTYENIENIERL